MRKTDPRTLLKNFSRNANSPDAKKDNWDRDERFEKLLRLLGLKPRENFGPRLHKKATDAIDRLSPEKAAEIHKEIMP